MDSVIDLRDPTTALDLSRIRYQLIRLEDTITFHLIERAQFPLNKSIYLPGAVPIRDSLFSSWPLALISGKFSFMDWYLRQQEALQSRIRRFESPDEYPFFPGSVQVPILRPLNYPQILHQNDVVVNDRIKQYYIEELLPALCPDFGHGDRGETQENYGSSATCDIACLQALSRRIHFGKFVAESKFREDPETYTRLILAEDREGLGDAIINKKVEQLVLQRMRRKVETYGQELTAEGATGSTKIDADAVVSMYENFVIPLTKDVEVEYLMQRLNEEKTPWFATVPASDITESLVWGLGVGGGLVAAALLALRFLPPRH